MHRKLLLFQLARYVVKLEQDVAIPIFRSDKRGCVQPCLWLRDKLP